MTKARYFRCKLALPQKKTEEHDEEVIVSKASATAAQLMWQSRQIYLDG